MPVYQSCLSYVILMNKCIWILNHWSPKKKLLQIFLSWMLLKMSGTRVLYELLENCLTARSFNISWNEIHVPCDKFWVNELGHRWFKKWLAYFNKCWLIVSWSQRKELQWLIFIHENAFKNVVGGTVTFTLRHERVMTSHKKEGVWYLCKNII